MFDLPCWYTCDIFVCTWHDSSIHVCTWHDSSKYVCTWHDSSIMPCVCTWHDSSIHVWRDLKDTTAASATEVMIHPYMCGMTHSYMRAMTHPYMTDMTQSYVSGTTCVTQVQVLPPVTLLNDNAWVPTHSYDSHMWHNWLICDTTASGHPYATWDMILVTWPTTYRTRHDTCDMTYNLPYETW